VNYNTFSFWLLFAAVLVPYWRLSHKGQNRLLLAASYVFYGTWDYRFLFLILLSTMIDYVGGLGVAGRALARGKLCGLGALLFGASLVLCSHVAYGDLWSALLHGDARAAVSALPHRWRDLAVPAATAAAVLGYGRLLPRLYALAPDRRRKWFLAISMVANLLILGVFKYCDFFATNLVAVLHWFGLSPSWTALHIVLPAGISFYTFQAMSYTIDVYRGDCEPTESFQDFALFVCFFPHLVAGPIMRAHTLLPQIVGRRALARSAAAEGLLLVLIGLVKKVAIADTMAPIADAVFFRFHDGAAAGVGGPEALLGVYAFAMQIYGDFSGYSAIARGISKWLGFELVVNFDQPYFAVSPSDFWRRWHISLSTWLRDYLYIPLGGNRHGVRKQYRNLTITMLLGGLWHGASFTFVAWGLYHGAILCLYRLLGVRDDAPGARPGDVARRWLRIGVMFQLTCVGWLLFRADSFSAAYAIARRIATDFHVNRAALAPGVAILALYALPVLGLERLIGGERDVLRIARASWPTQTAAYAYLTMMILFFHAGRAHEFIYFQF